MFIVFYCSLRLRLAAGGEIAFLSARTVAKYIIKCSLFILSLNSVFSAGTAAKNEQKAHYFFSASLAANRCKLLLV